MWEKRLGEFAGRKAWHDDFPFDHDLPSPIVLDCRTMHGVVHPMFAIRMRMFIDWHRSYGREVQLIPPTDPQTHANLDALGLAQEALGGAPEGDLVVPITRLLEFGPVDEAAERTRELLEYKRSDIAALGQATHMTIGELCGNAVEHGANDLGAYVAAVRVIDPRPMLRISIADLGIGIPEHIRRQYPEWVDDTAAIGKATQEHVSGTGDPHRGNGISSVFDEALTQALHAATIEIHSARGFLRTVFVQGERQHIEFPAPSFRRGTWINCELVSA